MFSFDLQALASFLLKKPAFPAFPAISNEMGWLSLSSLLKKLEKLEKLVFSIKSWQAGIPFDLQALASFLLKKPAFPAFPAISNEMGWLSLSSLLKKLEKLEKLVFSIKSWQAGLLTYTNQPSLLLLLPLPSRCLGEECTESWERDALI